MLLVRRHPSIGGELVAQRALPHAGVPIVREAHERMDGLGYPHGRARRRRLASAPESSASPTPTTP